MSIPTKTVQMAPFAPIEDAHGLVDAWAAPTDVEVYGWAPPTPSPAMQPIEDNRRPTTVDLDLYLPSVHGQPRAHWTLPGMGTLEQVGRTVSYADGPWWPTAGAVAQLRRIEG